MESKKNTWFSFCSLRVQCSQILGVWAEMVFKALIDQYTTDTHRSSGSIDPRDCRRRPRRIRQAGEGRAGSRGSLHSLRPCPPGRVADTFQSSINRLSVAIPSYLHGTVRGILISMKQVGQQAISATVRDVAKAPELHSVLSTRPLSRETDGDNTHR